MINKIRAMPDYGRTRHLPQVVVLDGQRQGAGRAARELELGFLWSNSAEGQHFWMAVADRLRQIATDGIIRDRPVVKE